MAAVETGCSVASSTNKVEVFRLGPVGVHPNADRLECVTAFGWSSCIQTGQFKEGDLVCFVPPDNILPDKAEYGFLQGKLHIKAKKLRGVLSYGLVLAAPPGSHEGDDVALSLGITHYEPIQPAQTGGQAEKAPELFSPEYDVEAFQRYASLFSQFEPVIVTEKLHGSCGRWVFTEGRMWAGSKKEWKKQSETNLWWRAMTVCPWIETFCRFNPDHIVYGEVYGFQKAGNVKFSYALEQGGISVKAFDILYKDRWLDSVPARQTGKDLQWVPTVAVTDFSPETLKLADGPSMVPGTDHLREGIVIKPQKERTHLAIGRVQLKLVSSQYLLL